MAKWLQPHDLPQGSKIYAAGQAKNIARILEPFDINDFIGKPEVE
jgi:hypothetical protein